MFGRTSRDFKLIDLFKGGGAEATTRDYRARQEIFAQGDEADAMFYIQTGNVKLTVASKGGKKAVIAILRHGDCFGENCLTRRSLRISTATAIHPPPLPE